VEAAIPILINLGDSKLVNSVSRKIKWLGGVPFFNDIISIIKEELDRRSIFGRDCRFDFKEILARRFSVDEKWKITG
jgi:hypothetical protein